MRPEARIQSAIDLLDRILQESEVPADRIAQDYFRHNRYIGSHDRNSVGDLVYRVLRNYPQLAWLDTDSNARRAVLLHLYRHEDHDVAKLKETFCGGQYNPSPLTPGEINLLQRSSEATDMPLWASLSIPEWLCSHFEDSFGADSFQNEITALNNKATVDLRVNSLRNTRQIVLELLQAENIPAIPTPFSPLGIRLLTRVPFGNHPLWKDGTLEAQDEGSQMISLLCDAKPGMVVLDYCAGAGGKSLAMAASMNNKGRLVATDIFDWRLNRAKERFKKAGIDNTECRLLTEEKGWLKRQQGKFDRVLVDVPCSGTGTWRRNPDLKIRFQEQDLLEIIQKQQEIMTAAAKMVKLGGRLIYATCSLLRSENHRQIETFISNNPEFSLIPIQDVWQEVLGSDCPSEGPMLQLTPAQHNMDGFFVAVMKKTA
ncbi:MAG: RsmB/NOP family class I SAM-dependent RNA methyltransferase [Alphaproteobacteria bacterium]|nr:RsmB/NOP family class I SAM-dependent RNA methyltransferase [Alphaproteobacteria bacterium]